MGGSTSKTAIESLSSSITEVAMSTVQNCEVAAQQDQTLVVKNTGFKLWGDYKLEQQSEIKSDCFSDISKQTDLQNKIIDTISQSTSASNVALLGAFGKTNSEASANLTNIIKNNITMSNIQNSYSSIKQNQSATFENSGIVGFENVDLIQGSKLFAAATLKEIDKSGIFNQVEKYVDQTSSSTQTNPLDFIADAFGAVTSSIMMWIVLFMIAIIMIGVGIFYGPRAWKALNASSDNLAPGATVTTDTTNNTTDLI